MYGHSRCKFRYCHFTDILQKSPLVGVRLEVFVYENAVAFLSCPPLKRQCHEIPEASCRHHVLIRKEAVVRLKRHTAIAFHSFSKDCIADQPRITGFDFIREEYPNVSAIA